MAAANDSYDPFAILEAPARSPDVTPAAQRCMFSRKRNDYFRHSYTQLPPDHIRILIIRPSEPGTRLELDLMAVPFEEPYTNLVPYEALSYEWANEPAVSPVILRDYTIRSLSERFPINEQAIQYQRYTPQWRRVYSTYWKRALFSVCRDGKKMQKDDNGHYTVDAENHLVGGAERFGTTALIQANFHSALEHIRDRKEAVRLWADALCIDQSDNEEKTRQIARMGQIYNRALNVRIWLGGKSDQSDVATEYVREIQERGSISNFFESDLHQGKTKWRALVELMQSGWFSRRWAVTELALARRASIYCGNKKLSWADFSSAITTFSDEARIEKLNKDISSNKQISARNSVTTKDSLMRRSSRPQLTAAGLRAVEGSSANALIAAYADLVRLGDKGVVVELKKTLEELITTLTSFHCSDPRDIIYAVLPVAADCPQDHIRPDRSKSLLQVYTEFIQYCVHHNGSLNMICRHWAPEGRAIIQEVSKKDKRRFESSLPSWIKCLEHSTYFTPDKVFVGQKEADSLVGPPSRSWYKASGTHKPVVEFGRKPPPDKPVVLYEEFDGTAKVLGVKLGEIQESSPRMIPGIVPQEAIALGGWQHSGVGKKSQVVPENLWRTLIANRTKDGSQPPPIYANHCLHMLQKQDVYGDILLDSIIAAHDVHDSMLEFLQRVRDVCMNRRVFVGGREKELVGLCPKQSEVGDFICVLYGCNVPVVLRQHTSVPVFGLDPTCNNDPTENVGPQASRTITSDAPMRRSTLIVREVTKDDGIDELPNRGRETEPRPNRPFHSLPQANKGLHGQSNEQSNKSGTSLQVFTDGAWPLGSGDVSRASTFPAEHDDRVEGELVNANGIDVTSAISPDERQRNITTRSPYYEVIGECFVCDRMDGEVFQGSISRTMAETFTLI